MSAVKAATGQVIMHPVVSKSLKIWATTLGRDKVSTSRGKPGERGTTLPANRYRLTAPFNTLLGFMPIFYSQGVIRRTLNTGRPLRITLRLVESVSCRLSPSDY
jgi:hypothetical protein